MQLIQQLNNIIEEWHLLKHPFYQAWSNGELNQAILKQYAIQYYQQVQSFPRFISRVHTHCPNIDVRKKLLENLVDEEIHGTDHPALWMQFAEGLGATAADFTAEKPLPQTHDMVNTYYDLANNWQAGLCALYAYEYQVPAVAASKIAGLKKFYGINDARTLEFFTAHEAYDVEHANQVADLITHYVTPDIARNATEKAAIALWKFLDGMCEQAGIVCEQTQHSS